MTSWRAYWDTRARELGPRACGHYRWTPAQFAQNTEDWWQRFVPYVQGDPILDFGCGSGRFSRRLAALGKRVVGVDISPVMLAMASDEAMDAASPPPHYVLIDPGEPLPFQTSRFASLVAVASLHHVPDEDMLGTVAELHRVLRPDASVVVIASTAQPGQARLSRSGHTVHREPWEYVQCFRGLAVIETVMVRGDPCTIFAGTLHNA